MAIRTAVNRALTAITALPTAAALTDGNLTLLTTATITFQGSTDTGSNYGVNITSAAFVAYHNEAGNSAVLEYGSNSDLAQSTSFQMISGNAGNGNDESISGELTLFNPSSTTFVKHFIARSNCYNANDYSQDFYVSGYFNTTSAIDAIQFKMVSGNIDAGTIKMYGVGPKQS